MPTRDQVWPAGTPCWVDAQVDDIPKAVEFYHALFGWELFDAGPDAGGYHMAYIDDRAVAGIGFKPPGTPAHMPSTWTTYLASDDVDATADKVTGAGGTLLAPPMDVMTAGRMAVAADPGGAVFGIWRGRDTIGFGYVNEPGGVCWNELHTPDLVKAQEFYQAAFGYTYDKMPGPPGFDYATFTVTGGSESCGGMYHDTSLPPGHPPYWLTWFAVADCDAATDTATKLGSTVFMQPETSPIGRMSVVQGPQRESFGLIDMSKRADPPSEDKPAFNY